MGEAPVPRDGAIIFRELAGELEVLNIECDKCGRRGRYHLHRRIERCGIDAKLFGRSDEITADCPRKLAKNLSDMCGARCPQRWSKPSPTPWKANFDSAAARALGG
jgi:hypothetical protein